MSGLCPVDQLKRLDINVLSELEKLKLKTNRPTPDITIIQECTSKGLKLII